MQENVQVIQAYFQDHDSRYLAENVEFYDMSAAQPVGFLCLCGFRRERRKS